LAFISTANAQWVSAVDNKGTIKKINKVTTDDTEPAAADSLTGDIWFDDSAAPTQTKIYDGSNWNTVGAVPSVYTGVFVIERTTPITKNITGIPFQPSQVTFVAHANVDVINTGVDGAISPSSTNNIGNSFGTMNGFANASTGTIEQQVIYLGGSGASINRIGYFSSPSHCIGVRYGNQNAENLGIIKGALTSFTTDGFDIEVTYNVSGIDPNDFRAEKLVVLYTAYK